MTRRKCVIFRRSKADKKKKKKRKGKKSEGKRKPASAAVSDKDVEKMDEDELVREYTKLSQMVDNRNKTHVTFQRRV